MLDKRKFNILIKVFQKDLPNASSELNFENEYQLLVAVVLSAQCTDKRVNIITPPLFLKYPNFEKLANAEFEEVFDLIKSCSYPNNKSKHLITCSNQIVSNYNGSIPSTIEELIKLAGVGRKTANVLLSILHNKPAMAVDTHVYRVSKRIGLSNAKNVYECEMQLTKLFPENLIPIAHHWLILHGRYICTARKPKCEKCSLSLICEKNI